MLVTASNVGMFNEAMYDPHVGNDGQAAMPTTVNNIPLCLQLPFFRAAMASNFSLATTDHADVLVITCFDVHVQ